MKDIRHSVREIRTWLEAFHANFVHLLIYTLNRQHCLQKEGGKKQVWLILNFVEIVLIVFINVSLCPPNLRLFCISGMCAAPLLGDGAVLTSEKMRIHPPSSSPITFIASERGGWRGWPFFPPPVLFIRAAVRFLALLESHLWLHVFGPAKGINWQDSRCVWHGLGLLHLIVSVKYWQVSEKTGSQVRKLFMIFCTFPITLSWPQDSFALLRV